MYLAGKVLIGILFVRLLLETRPLFYVVIRAVCREKAVPLFLSYLTLSIGPVPGIDPATSRSAVKCSTDWANPAVVEFANHFVSNQAVLNNKDRSRFSRLLGYAKLQSRCHSGYSHLVYCSSFMKCCQSMRISENCVIDLCNIWRSLQNKTKKKEVLHR